MANEQPDNQLEQFLGILIGAFILATPISLLSLGLGLMFLGLLKAIGLGIVVLLISTAFFTRKLVKQELTNKQN